MQIIHDHLHHWNESLGKVFIQVDRLTLAKRRWRGVASDGVEFGFDMEHHLHDGDVIFQSDHVLYVLQQSVEPVLKITLSDNALAAARIGWMIGNLHFPLEVVDGGIQVADDSALRQLFEREKISFTVTQKIFHPLSGAHHH